MACHSYRVKWKLATDMAKSGDAYNAVVVLQEMLKEFEEQRQSSNAKGRFGGAGAGAALGTLLFPGIGTVIGTAIGGLVGDRIGKSLGASEQASFEAETHYRLGVIYEMMHHPGALSSYMQARLLDSEHKRAEEALRRLQPAMPASPLLDSLDD